MCFQAARRRAAHGAAAGLLDVGMQVEQQRAAEQEGGHVDEQGRRRARRGDARPPDAGPSDEGGGEGDVEGGIGLALGLLGALVLLPRRLAHGDPQLHRLCASMAPSRAPPRCAAASWPQRGGAVERRQQQHAGSQKCHSEHRERGRRDGLEEVQRRSARAPRSEASTRATSAGHDERRQRLAGEQQRATASALWVWSKTASDSATTPNQRAQPIDRVGGEDPAQPRPSASVDRHAGHANA